MKPEQRLPLDDQWLQIHNTVSPVTKPELNGSLLILGAEIVRPQQTVKGIFMLYHLGNITIDTNSFAVLHEGSPVHSEPLTFDLICYLIERRDRVVTRHELLKALWPNQYVTDGSVSNEIKEARKCLADSGKKQHVIKTHHGRGYQFIAEVTEISSFQPPPTNEPRTDNHLITPLPTALALSLEQHRFSTIPYPITRFVGRKIELEYLAEKLLNYPDDILSIVGPGGCRKNTSGNSTCSNPQI